ncbi:hypothetical protein MTO96_033191 [Rhipicephalus appendiculatus]
MITIVTTLGHTRIGKRPAPPARRTSLSVAAGVEPLVPADHAIAAEVDSGIAAMKPSSAGSRASGAAGTSTGEAEAEGASASSGRGKSKTSEGAKQPSDPTKIMRSALRVLKLRLDRVGRKLSELDFDNRALMGRVQFFRSENCKLHQALEKERVKVRNSPDRSSGAGPSSAQGGATCASPTGASTSAGAILSGGRGSPSGVAKANGIGPTTIEQASPP